MEDGELCFLLLSADVVFVPIPAILPRDGLTPDGNTATLSPLPREYRDNRGISTVLNNPRRSSAEYRSINQSVFLDQT